MPKVTLKSSLSVVYLGSDDEPTATRAVIEEASPGRWVAHAVISPLDVGPHASEDGAAHAVLSALDQLALRVLEAFAVLKVPESEPAAPTDADIVRIEHTELLRAAGAAAALVSPMPGAATVVASHTAVTADVRPGEPGAVIIRDPLHGAPPVAPSVVGPLGFPVVEIVEAKSK